MGENMHTRTRKHKDKWKSILPRIFLDCELYYFSIGTQTTTAFRMLSPNDDASSFYQTLEVAEYWVLLNQ